MNSQDCSTYLANSNLLEFIEMATSSSFSENKNAAIVASDSIITQLGQIGSNINMIKNNVRSTAEMQLVVEIEIARIEIRKTALQIKNKITKLNFRLDNTLKISELEKKKRELDNEIELLKLASAESVVDKLD
jgi:hypothetical protein